MRSIKKIINRYNRNCEKHGLWEHYFENGNLYSIGLYKNGMGSGNWEFYYSNGGLRDKKLYREGVLI